MRVLVVLLAVGCRIGFDPIASDSGAGDDTDPQGDPTSTCTTDSICDYACTPGQECIVDCAGTAVCRVTCPDPLEGCTVINCGPTCNLDCNGSPPFRTGSTLTCL